MDVSHLSTNTGINKRKMEKQDLSYRRCGCVSYAQIKNLKENDEAGKKERKIRVKFLIDVGTMISVHNSWHTLDE